MNPRDYDYTLPATLIAQSPALTRESSRLLSLTRSSATLRDCCFTELTGLLKAGDLLVFNDTRVIPARLSGHKSSGGKVEVFLERIIDHCRFVALLKSGKTPKPGAIITLSGSEQIKLLGREDNLFTFAVLGDCSVLELFEQQGAVPLPPYIRREVQNQDRERYQTVYARNPGAVAAPTAGLHFTRELFEQLHNQGIDTGFLTLHVGSGTFLPVRTDDLDAHKMHCERFEISQMLVDQIEKTRARQGRVIAVGTTVVRTLESVAHSGGLRAIQGETDLFIRDGFEFRLIDGLLTNFHLPRSTLLMLVCAFAGHSVVMNAYAHAVQQEYRFFSYGDAMLIL